MTAASTARSTAAAAAPTASRRGTVAGALALATVTLLPTAGLAAGAPAEPPLARVVVSAVGQGAVGVGLAADAVRAAGGRVLERLPLVDGVAAELPAGRALAPGLLVTPDREVRLASGDGAWAPGEPGTVRGTLGLGAPDGEGAGVTVAVVDTGVADVPDLAGRLTQVDVTGTGAGDGYGHGTFVAGLVAGDGGMSDGEHAGVAPGADVLSVRVADGEGRTNLLTVLRGLEVARAHDADVVNLSLSSYSPLPWQLDPLTLALGALWRHGAVVVVPAGNDGPDAATITSPGVHPDLLTVGSLDDQGTVDRVGDALAAFSAVGPAPQGVAKPELVAPGARVVSLQAPGSRIAVDHGAAAVGEHYFTGSGTSFSTAVVAGAAAVLLAERDLDPMQVKGLLTATAYQVAGDAAGLGAGGLDLAAARTATPPAAAPVVSRPGRRVGQIDMPGTPGDWKPLVRALVRGDAATAASSWSRMPAEVKAWVASSWSALPADLRDELLAEWGGRNWGLLSPEEWAQVDWAGRNWAGRNWAASSWSGRNWGGRNWGASSWSQTVDDDWLDGWGGRNWGGRNWAASSWSGRNWGASSWAASSWAASSWAAGSWAAAAWGT